MLAIGQDVGTIGDRQGLPDVVIGDQHAHAATAQAIDQVLEVGDGHGIHPGEGLIEEEITRPLVADGQGPAPPPCDAVPLRRAEIHCGAGTEAR